MTRPTFFAAVLLSVVLVVRGPHSTDSFAVREQARVRAHFDSAEREVRAHSVTGLSTAQRAARARALDRVHEYARRGVFPVNRDFPGRLVPYFVDTRTGTLCGMAYLIEQAGSGPFVARIAETNNNATIRDLQDDPELLAWLDRNGLTLDEAARIQPAYSCEEWPDQYGCRQASSGYKTTTGVSVGVDVLAVALNSLRTSLSPSVTGAAGIATGIVGIAVGAPNLSSESASRRTFGRVNVGAGAVSAVFGMYRLARNPSASRANIAPWISSNGTPGVSARLTF